MANYELQPDSEAQRREIVELASREYPIWPEGFQDGRGDELLATTDASYGQPVPHYSFEAVSSDPTRWLAEFFDAAQQPGSGYKLVDPHDTRRGGVHPGDLVYIQNSPVSGIVTDGGSVVVGNNFDDRVQEVPLTDFEQSVADGDVKFIRYTRESDNG